MRLLMMTLTMAVMLCSGTQASGQTADAGADPFAPGTPQTKAAHKKKAPQAVVQRAKKELAKGRKPIETSGYREKEMEVKIDSALGDKTSFTFIETPLGEAVQVLSQTHDIPIIVDRRALEEIGLTPDAPVTLDLHNVSLRAALRLMLRDLDLTYLVKDEVLQITTSESAEQNLVLRMYVLPENLAKKSDSVVKVLTSTVVPDAWESLGGPSVAIPMDHVLVVSTTSDVHDKTQNFLTMLTERYGK